MHEFTFNVLNNSGVKHTRCRWFTTSEGENTRGEQDTLDWVSGFLEEGLLSLAFMLTSFLPSFTAYLGADQLEFTSSLASYLGRSRLFSSSAHKLLIQSSITQRMNGCGRGIIHERTQKKRRDETDLGKPTTQQTHMCYVDQVNLSKASEGGRNTKTMEKSSCRCIDDSFVSLTHNYLIHAAALVVAVWCWGRGSITRRNIGLVLRLTSSSTAALAGETMAGIVGGSVSGLQRRRRHDALRWGRGGAGGSRGCWAMRVVALVLRLLLLLGSIRAWWCCCIVGCLIR